MEAPFPQVAPVLRLPNLRGVRLYLGGRVCEIVSQVRMLTVPLGDTEHRLRESW
jgi:hypothetical protein